MEDKELRDSLLARAKTQRVRAFLKMVFDPVAINIEEEGARNTRLI